MKKLMYITMAIISLFLVSCSDGNGPVGNDEENGLLGTWVNSSTLDDGIEMDITLALLETSEFTISTETTFYIDDLAITTSCSGSGDWSSTDTEISFSEGTMSCDALEEDIDMQAFTSSYVLSGDILTLIEIDGEERVYTRQ